MDGVQAKVSELLKEAGAKGEPSGRIEPVAFGIKHLYITAMFETTDERRVKTLVMDNNIRGERVD